MSSRNFHVAAGQTTRAPYDVVVTPDSAGWTYTGLSVLSLGAGESATLETEGSEMILLSLARLVRRDVQRRDAHCRGTHRCL